MPKVSVHLVTWNGQKYIADCLESVLQQSFTDFFVLVIDNGSIDDTVSIIEQTYLPLFGDRIRLVKNKENIGFARAHNQALLWTDSPYVLPLNQDMILDPNFISQGVQFMEQHKRVGSLAPKLLRWEGKADELTKGVKSTTVDTLGMEIRKSQRVFEVGVGETDNGQFNEVKEIFGVSGAAPLYNRKALEDVRYNDEFFDNDFVSYKEDVDLAYRLRWRGWKSFFVPSMVGYHDRTAHGTKHFFSITDFKLRLKKSKFISYLSYRNQLWTIYKNISARMFLRYFVYILLYEVGKPFYMLVFETKNLALFKDIWKKRKKMRAKRQFIQSHRIITDEEMRKWMV